MILITAIFPPTYRGSIPVSEAVYLIASGPRASVLQGGNLGWGSTATIGTVTGPSSYLSIRFLVFYQKARTFWNGFILISPCLGTLRSTS